jgi:hypothetical protein
MFLDNSVVASVIAWEWGCSAFKMGRGWPPLGLPRRHVGNQGARHRPHPISPLEAANKIGGNRCGLTHVLFTNIVPPGQPGGDEIHVPGVYQKTGRCIKD